MVNSTPYHLFDVVGIELEYMIVDASTLDVRPISHHLLKDAQNEPVSEIEHGRTAWSNELTHHVIELKTNGPRASLAGLADDFQLQIQVINKQLADDGARLLPTAMHPWMNPDREMQLWPYDYSPVYEAFHKVFDCRGHGWANLQSMHINLPFCGDEEFARLHAAIRLVLPILPGLAASSPWIEGKFSGVLDKRLDVYANNSRKIPSVAGRVIPEAVFSRQEYDQQIFQPMFSEIAPFDPDGFLQDEFLNSRGAIARFERGAIEIRVIDVQECPLADVAIAALTIAVVKKLVAEDWSPLLAQKRMDVETLRSLFDATIQTAEQTVLSDAGYLDLFGIQLPSISVGELWRTLFDQVKEEIRTVAPELISPMEFILSHGSLARRMTSIYGENLSRNELHAIYELLANCLEGGQLLGAKE